MNKPRPGAYRHPLAQGLNLLEQPVLAEQAMQGTIKIAVAGSIYGDIKVRSDLTPIYVEALRAAKHEFSEYYAAGLEAGTLVPVVTASADVVYTDGPTTPTEKEFAPGELFFTS